MQLCAQKHLLTARHAHLLHSLRLCHGFGFAPASVSLCALRRLHRRQHGRPLFLLRALPFALRSGLYALWCTAQLPRN